MGERGNPCGRCVISCIVILGCVSIVPYDGRCRLLLQQRQLNAALAGLRSTHLHHALLNGRLLLLLQGEALLVYLLMSDGDEALRLMPGEAPCMLIRPGVQVFGGRIVPELYLLESYLLVLHLRFI